MYFSDWLCCTIQRDYPFDQTENICKSRSGHETNTSQYPSCERQRPVAALRVEHVTAERGALAVTVAGSRDETMALLVADKALTAVGEQVALILGLEHLSPHFRTVVFSALGFHVVELLAGPISARLFGQRYTRLKLNARRTWAERFVSLAHASVLLPLTFHAKFYSAAAETLARDKAFGWHPDVGRLFGFSVG